MSKNTIERFDIGMPSGMELAYAQALSYLKRNVSAAGIKTLGQRDMIARYDRAQQTQTTISGKTIHKPQRAKVRQS